MAKVSESVSAGQALVTRIMVWMLTFVAMPREYALVCTLFAINSYWYRVFDACPYLSIVAATKRAGKSTLLETVASLCLNGDVSQNTTEPTLFAKIEGSQGWVVPCLDEFELRDDDMGQTLNSGYRSTGMAERKNRKSGPGEPATLRYSTYCQKVFACIGDLIDTLRDRSIVLTMTRGNASRKYRYSEMSREARAFAAEIKAIVRDTFPREAPTVYDVTWLDGRDEEIWAPLFTTAQALGLDAAMMAELTLASKRLTRAKSAEALEYTQRQIAEDTAADKSHGEDLIRDILKVIAADESKIWTADVIQRLHKREGWDTFRGTGLTAHSLSELLAPFGIAPKQVFIGSKREGKNRQGYDVADLKRAAAKHIG